MSEPAQLTGSRASFVSCLRLTSGFSQSDPPSTSRASRRCAVAITEYQYEVSTISYPFQPRRVATRNPTFESRNASPPTPSARAPPGRPVPATRHSTLVPPAPSEPRSIHGRAAPPHTRNPSPVPDSKLEIRDSRRPSRPARSTIRMQFCEHSLNHFAPANLRRFPPRSCGLLSSPIRYPRFEPANTRSSPILATEYCICDRLSRKQSC